MLEFSFQRLQLEEHGVCAEVNCSLHLRDDEFTVIRAQGDPASASERHVGTELPREATRVPPKHADSSPRMV